MEEPSLAGGIAVLDFGGQYAHLICRRVRALGVYAALLPHDTPLGELRRLKVAGVILSGSPLSVRASEALSADPALFKGEVPVLGICYGYQLMVQAHGGEVTREKAREYGRTKVKVVEGGGILGGAPGDTFSAWMSHSDSATSIPDSMQVLAATDRSPYAAVRVKGGSEYGVQFHPEVSHTENGGELISNFVFGVCGAARKWSMETFLKDAQAELSKLDGRALCAVSGGVDSSVTAALLAKSVGERLTCVFIDTGLLRSGEAEAVSSSLGGETGVKVEVLDASERFLAALKGVRDPEEKRKVIGKTFADVFEEFARKKGPFRYLAQGTLYPDVVESGRSKGPASLIKTHHNVGGLPEKLSMSVVEPLRDLYKDEVRSLGALMGLPAATLGRHPFPGPGLGVRVIGEVTEEKLRICRDASRVVEEVLRQTGEYGRAWQAFAYVGDDLVTGVEGDERRVGHQVVVKVVESVDGMTADWARLDPNTLEHLSSRITNEVDGVVAVAYSVSSKPPATIEPQ